MCEIVCFGLALTVRASAVRECHRPGGMGTPVRSRPGPGKGVRQRSANGATEANHVTVRITDETFSLAVALVAWADHVDSGLPPLLGNPVGVLTVNVENSVTSCFILRCLGKVNREVSVSVRERVGVVVERHIESRTAEPGNGAGHISDLEDRLKTGHQPCTRYELQLAVSLSIEPV